MAFPQTNKKSTKHNKQQQKILKNKTKTIIINQEKISS